MREIPEGEGLENPQEVEEKCRLCGSFGTKCSHIVKKQRARFYILRRCIAMLLCSKDRTNDS